MSIIEQLKRRLSEALSLPQDKKSPRVFDALAALFCFLCAAIALYILKTQPVASLPSIVDLVILIYLVFSLPIGYLLYKPTNLKKYERFSIVLFVLASSMSLMIVVMMAMVGAE